MKLRNKKTGEIKECAVIPIIDGYVNEYEVFEKGDSLAELNAEWEDMPEEPKEYWYIDDAGVIHLDQVLSSEINMRKSIGNYFDTREEAEKAVEKLKAAKLLKDMGFKIVGIRYRNNRSYIEWNISPKVRDEHFMAEAFYDALHLLFGGEE